MGFFDMFKKPKYRDVKGGRYTIGQELAVSTSARAPGVPKWKNPLTDRLDRDAYLHIRRCEVTAQPMEKFATLLADYRIVAVSRDPAVAEMVKDFCLSEIRGATDMIEWLAAARVEGVSFYAIDYVLDEATGWHIPDLTQGGRRKESAGGNILWDGETVYKAREDGALATEAERAAATLNRDRFVVFSPGGNSSPEGSYEMAWRGYNLVVEYENVLASTAQYGERWGNPFKFVAQNLKHVDAGKYAERVEKVARKLARAPKEGFVSDALMQAVQIIEPSGSTATFLVEYRKLLQSEAHRWMLGQDLTSTTGAAGPTGSSSEAKDTEAKVIRRYAEALSSAIDRDLGGFIRKYNEYFLKGKARFRLELAQPPTTKELAINEAQILHSMGLDFDADFLYQLAGAERPAGAADVIKGRPDTSPLGGPAFGNPDAALMRASRPKACCGDGPTATGNAALAAKTRKKAGFPYDLEALFQALKTEANLEMAHAWRSILGQVFIGKTDPIPPKAVVSSISKARAIGYLAGIVKIASQLDFTTGEIGPPDSKPLAEILPKFIDKKVAEAIQGLAKELDVPESFAREIVDKVRREEPETMRPIVGKLNEKALELKARYEAVRIQEAREAVRKGEPPPVRSEADFVKYAEAADPDVPKNSARAVYRNESAEAYRQGGEAGLARVRQYAGGWRFDTVGDASVRPSHAALDGIIFPLDDMRLMPPFAFNCRCTFVVVPKEQASQTVSAEEADALYFATAAADEGAFF